MIQRLQRWLDARIRDAVQAGVDAALHEERDRFRIDGADPLQRHTRQDSDVRARLASLANVVGDDIMVGDDVVIWGGRFTDGVGLELHSRVRVYSQCALVIDQVSPQSGIVLEERVAMNFRCYIEGAGGVRIGRGTILGPNVVIVSSGHRIDPELDVQESGKHFAGVTIGDAAWLGANVVVLAGVRIGHRAVVGAGAVVTRDVPDDAVAVGNPARLIRSKK